MHELANLVITLRQDAKGGMTQLKDCRTWVSDVLDAFIADGICTGEVKGVLKVASDWELADKKRRQEQAQQMAEKLGAKV